VGETIRWAHGAELAVSSVMRTRWLVVMVVVAGCTDAPAPDGRLSSEGLYADLAAKTISKDAIELRPAYPLWSDGAEKRRWIMLPPNTTIDTSDMDHWQVPIGTKLFKEFALGGRRIETRMIERVGATDYRFSPFVWCPDEAEAMLTMDGATDVLNTGHDVPSGETCESCHRGEPGTVLGVSAVQLSAMLDELPLSQPPLRTFPIANPVLGMLHANCGHCHSDGGIAAVIDLRLRLSIHDAGLPQEQTAPYLSMVGVPLTNWRADGITERVVPGDPAASGLYYRMSQRGTGAQMPPLATEVTDDVARRQLWDWIARL